MTVVETEAVTPAPPPFTPLPLTPKERWNRTTIFGTAASFELGERDLHVIIVRARPGGATVVAKTTIADYRTRPPKDWGSEYHKWLREHGERNLSALAVLPRRESIVRVVGLPGVVKKDIPSAIGYQVDALHPYGDEEVSFGWAPIGGGNVLLGMMRRVTLEAYVQLFQDAGVPCSGFTFSASALHCALHLYRNPPPEFLAFAETEPGIVEVYGQSAARPVFSAEFHLPLTRALALSRAELRLPNETASRLWAVLPEPRNTAAVPSIAFAGALAQVGAWRNPYANLLPTERRIIRSRARFIPTIILALALAAAAGSWFAYQQMRDQQYSDVLHRRKFARSNREADQAAILDKRTEDHRARIKFIDDYRKRDQGFIDVMLELTRLLPPPIWTQSVDITLDTVNDLRRGRKRRNAAQNSGCVAACSGTLN